jgi:TRAP-type C4-dicarboxylate transport system permease small subunit
VIVPRILDQASALANGLALVLAAVMAVLMIACLCGEVFFRYVLAHSLPWSEEVALLLFTWAVLLYGAVGVREGFHVRVSVMIDRLPAGARLWLERLILLGIAAFGAVMIHAGWDMVERNFGQVAPATRYPLALLYGAVPAMGALVVLHAVARALQPADIVRDGAGEIE